MSNIPNYEQWGKMNDYLNSIALSLVNNANESEQTWADIQKMVRLGIAPDLFPVGTQFTVPHSVYGDIVFDVVAHDHYKSANNETAHTMTLMAHNVVESSEFDATEAFYYAENDLPAGTYNFTLDKTDSTWAAGTYQFTLTQTLPRGGQLCLNEVRSVPLTNIKVNAYSSRTSTTVVESVAITVGNGGTSLGRFGEQLNHLRRTFHGSNNYKESAIRQFLNSSSLAGNVWVHQTKFDRAPSWMSTKNGFVNGIDQDFLACIGEVVVPCAASNRYESPDSSTTVGETYSVIDRFYIPSSNEIDRIQPYVVDDGTEVFPYYKGSANTDLIKYKNGNAHGWMSRSTFGSYDSSNFYNVLCIREAGDKAGLWPSSITGITPVCNIV